MINVKYQLVCQGYSAILSKRSTSAASFLTLFLDRWIYYTILAGQSAFKLHPQPSTSLHLDQVSTVGYIQYSIYSSAQLSSVLGFICSIARGLKCTTITAEFGRSNLNVSIQIKANRRTTTILTIAL